MEMSHTTLKEVWIYQEARIPVSSRSAHAILELANLNDLNYAGR